MSKRIYRESIKEKMHLVSSELSKLQSSKHILTGKTFKAWHVFDRKRETLEKQLGELIQEYQKILQNDPWEANAS